MKEPMNLVTGIARVLGFFVRKGRVAGPTVTPKGGALQIRRLQRGFGQHRATMRASISAFLLVYLAFAAPAAAITLDGGPEYIPPGAGSEVTSGDATLLGGYTIDETGYDLGQTGHLYFGVRADTYMNGYSMDGADISGDEIFRFAMKTANSIVYTGETTMVTTLNGTHTIATRMTITFTGTGVTVEDATTQALNDATNGDVGALWHVQSSDFSVNVLIEAQVPVFDPNAGNWEPANELFNRIETENDTGTSFDWAFYYDLCGNAAVDVSTGEECDDGNLDDDDCCSSTCQLPSSCLSGLKALFLVGDKSPDDKDVLKWKLVKGDEVIQADLGDPTTATAYTLCVYDETAAVPALVTALTVAPDGTKWVSKDPKGFLYKDKIGSSDGVQKVQLKTGTAGKAKLQVTAKGSAIPMPTPLNATEFFDQDTNVTVYVVNNATAACWQTDFVAAGTKKNTGEQFKANAP